MDCVRHIRYSAVLELPSVSVLYNLLPSVWKLQHKLTHSSCHTLQYVCNSILMHRTQDGHQSLATFSSQFAAPGAPLDILLTHSSSWALQNAGIYPPRSTHIPIVLISNKYVKKFRQHGTSLSKLQSWGSDTSARPEAHKSMEYAVTDRNHRKKDLSYV